MTHRGAMLLVGFGFVLVGTLIVIDALPRLSEDIELAFRGRRSTGTVTSYEPGSGSGKHRVPARIHFQHAIDGVSCHLSSCDDDDAYARRASAGERVEIEFLPSDPCVARAVGTRRGCGGYSNLFVFAGPLIGLALIAAYFFSREARTRRALRRLAVTPIARVADGTIAKVVGRLRFAKEPLSAPLSERPCAGYHVVVEDLNGKPSQLIEEEYCTDFIIEDETGKALIHINAPSVAITQDVHLRSGLFDNPTPAMEELLRRHGCSSHGTFLPRSLRYREGVLEENELVAVAGLWRWEVDPDPKAASGYREAARRLFVSPAGDKPVLVSDDPRAVK
jgi:hypothetical protein